MGDNRSPHRGGKTMIFMILLSILSGCSVNTVPSDAERTSIARFPINVTSTAIAHDATQTAYAQPIAGSSLARSPSAGSIPVTRMVIVSPPAMTLPPSPSATPLAPNTATPSSSPTLPPTTTPPTTIPPVPSPPAPPLPTSIPPPAPTPVATATERVVAISPAPPRPTEIPANIFRDPLARFSFTIPPGWRVQPMPPQGIVVQVVSNAPIGSMNITAEAVATNTSLDQYVAATLDNLQRSFPDYRLASGGVQPARLGAREARRYDLTVARAEGPMHITQYVALDARTAYVLTITAAEPDAGAIAGRAMLILDTFAFTA